MTLRMVMVSRGHRLGMEGFQALEHLVERKAWVRVIPRFGDFSLDTPHPLLGAHLIVCQQPQSSTHDLTRVLRAPVFDVLLTYRRGAAPSAVAACCWIR